MKKLFTLIVAAFMAVSVNAQTETPLVLGGGWNAGFAGDAALPDNQLLWRGRPELFGGDEQRPSLIT